MANRFCNLTGTNKIKDDFDNVNDGFDDVQQELDASDNRIDGHVAGASEKHSTTDITNSSNISGSTTTDVLNNVKTRMDDHVGGAAEKHGSSAITNQSSQSGITVTDAINSLAGVVQNITVTDSNANIGVYSLNASGTNTITTTFSGLTYFAGLKINLSIANDNTGAVTVNLNSLGAKNLYKVVKNVKTALSARDIRQGEIACMQYDGTDFILLNGERDAEYSTTTVSTSDINSLPSTAQGLIDSFVVKGRTVTNLLPDLTSISWTGGSNVTISVDPNNGLNGGDCLKLTVLDGTPANTYIDLMTYMDVSKHYLVLSHVKNGNLTNISTFLLNIPSGAVINQSTITQNTYIKNGYLLQPSNFLGQSEMRIYFQSLGTTGQYGYVDGLYLVEITSTEYALGVDALVAKYNFHLVTKSADKLRVKTVWKNLFDGKFNVDYAYSGGVLSSVTGYRASNKHKVNGASTCVLSGLPTTFGYVYQFDINGTYLGDTYRLYKANINSSFTVESNCRYITFAYYIADGSVATQVQLELGSTATTYEQYQQKQSSCPIELKAVSETITDIWNPLTGEVTKNIEKYSLVSGDIASLSALTNVSIVSIAKPANYKSKALGYNATFSDVLYPTYTIGTFVDDVAYIGKIFMQDATYWGIVVARTEYADLAAAKTALAGTDIYYQLSTPITTYLQPSTLLASANGTVEQSNNFATDFYIYRNSVLIPMYVDLYMRTVDEVRKWDLRDGSYTLIPLSDVTVSGGAVSAIVGSQEGDFYSVDYYGSSYQAVNGELNFSYPINAMGQIDVTTKEVIKLESTVKNLNAQIQELLVRIVKLENP